MPVDPEVRGALDGRLLSWKDVASRDMFGGVGYMVSGKMFAALAEGVVAMKLPDEQRRRALGLAGVSPFTPAGRPFGQWVQFLVLMEEDVSAVLPWVESAFEYVGTQPPPKKPKRRRSS